MAKALKAKFVEKTSRKVTAGALDLLGKPDDLIEFLTSDLKENMLKAHKESMNLKKVGSHNIWAIQYMKDHMPKWLDQVQKNLDQVKKEVKMVVDKGD